MVWMVGLKTDCFIFKEDLKKNYTTNLNVILKIVDTFRTKGNEIYLWKPLLFLNQYDNYMSLHTWPIGPTTSGAWTTLYQSALDLCLAWRVDEWDVHRLLRTPAGLIKRPCIALTTTCTAVSKTLAEHVHENTRNPHCIYAGVVTVPPARRCWEGVASPQVLYGDHRRVSACFSQRDAWRAVLFRRPSLPVHSVCPRLFWQRFISSHREARCFCLFSVTELTEMIPWTRVRVIRCSSLAPKMHDVQ